MLARSGHDVTLFERVRKPGPVGAGLLLQPTGIFVLDRLGILPRILDTSARIYALQGQTAGGRRVLDLRYGDIDSRYFGLGVHRGNLFAFLFEAVHNEGITVHSAAHIEHCNKVTAGYELSSRLGQRYGPFDVVIIANGTQSNLRNALNIKHSDNPYPWGALWSICPDPDGQFSGTLRQVYQGAKKMIGVLPTGTDPVTGQRCVSLFWSLPVRGYEDWKSRGIDAWKRELLSLWPELQPLLETIRSQEQLAFATYCDVRLSKPYDSGVICIGDAAHAMSPQLGQGANMALLDAWMLAQCFDSHDDITSCFAAYTRLRRAHLRYYQFASRWLTPLFQSRSTALGWFRDAVLPVGLALPPFYKLMLTTLLGLCSGILQQTQDNFRVEVLQTFSRPPLVREHDAAIQHSLRNQ